MASKTRMRLKNSEHSSITFDDNTETLFIHWESGGFTVYRCSNNEEYQQLKVETTILPDAQKEGFCVFSGTNP